VARRTYRVVSGAIDELKLIEEAAAIRQARAARAVQSPVVRAGAKPAGKAAGGKPSAGDQAAETTPARPVSGAAERSAGAGTAVRRAEKE